MGPQRLEEIKGLAQAAKRGDDAALGRLSRQATDIILELIAVVEQPPVMHPPPASGPWQTRGGAPVGSGNKTARKPRVVSVETAAAQLGVHHSTICRWLDARHLEPWFAPLAPGAKRRRRMVTMESVEKLLKRGSV